MLYVVPLTTLDEALLLAEIRNECRQWMTNDQHEISHSEQADWFFEVYQKQSPQFYNVWLLKEMNEKKDPVLGYFAAKECPDSFYVTEGLLESRRGQGAGTFLLQTLLSYEIFKNKKIHADIFNYNQASIRLHQKFGFKPYKIINNQITRFSLC